MNKPTAFITIGLPGSGKSTFSKRFLTWIDGLAVIVNRDALRNMIYGGQYNYNLTYEPVIKDMALSCAYAALNAGLSVIVDETNLSKKGRAYWVANITQAGYSVEFIYFPDNGMTLEYRMTEPRGYSEVYWKQVIERLRTTFEEPATDFSEGNAAFHVIPNPIGFDFKSFTR